MQDRTFNGDSIILDILEKNLGTNNAKKVFKLVSGMGDIDEIASKLEKTLRGKIPETRLEKMLIEFGDAKTILPDTHPQENIPKTNVKTKTLSKNGINSSTHISSEPKMYNIKSELGKGGMGAVYQAGDLHLERDVALKTIIGFPNDQTIKRFIREAKINARLEHPNIIPVHDFGINSKDEYYFTMKQVKGQELGDIIKGLSKGEKNYCEEYPLNKQLEVFNKVLDAIGFAHSKNVIHRDLKPANIMVGEFGEVLVMDWGLAKDKSQKDIISEKSQTDITEEDLTLDGQIMGSPGFMAPEQADGRIEDIDEQTDIWSLGAILYNMLSYKKPIEGKSIREVVINTVLEKIIPLKKRQQIIPPELESIVMKALNPKKKHRYENVKSMQEDINAYLNNRYVTAHKYSITHKISKWIQKHPTTTLTSSVALFLLLTSTLVGGTLYNEAQLEKIRATKAEDKADKEEKAKDRALVQRDAAQIEIEGQQQCEAILGNLKFLKQDENYYESALSIIKEAIKSSDNYWKPYLILAKHQGTFSHHEKAEKNFEKANKVYKKQFNKDSIEIFFEAGMYYGLPYEIGGRGLEEKALKFFEKAHKAGPKKVFGKLSQMLSLMIESKLKPKKAEDNLSQATELSDLLIEDKVAKSVDATWLARAWVYGISIASKFESPAFKKFADLEKARDALLRVVDEENGNVSIRNFLAMVQQELGEYDIAIKILSNCIKGNKSSTLYCNRGTAYEKKGELEKAIENYNKAIRLNPKDASAYYNRGTAYEKKGELEKAIENYNKAIKLNPKFVKAYVNRGFAYKKKGDLEKAITDYNKAIRLDPKFAKAYDNRGNAYEKKGDFEKAIKDYNKAIRLNPKYVDAYNNRGYAYEKKGDFEKAIKDYNESIRLNPKFIRAYVNRGNAYNKKGDFEKAIENHNEAIRLNPEYVDAYINRGNAYTDKSEFDKAIEDYNEAVRLDPKNAMAYHNRGFAYKKKGDLEKAITDYNKAIRLNPKNANAYHNRGFAYKKKGDLEKAIEDYNEAIRLNPKSVGAYCDRGFAYQDKGNLEKAIADYNEAIILNPKHADAYYNRGYVYCIKGDFEKAITDYNKAIRLNPKDANAYYGRGYVYCIKGDFEKAIADYNESIRLNPRCWQAYGNKGSILDKKGLYQEAIDTFQKAQKYAPANWKNKIQQWIEQTKKKIK